VNVTSFAGLFPGSFMLSAYFASKHATQAWSQALALEMHAWGVKVRHEGGVERGLWGR
jgi:short-subunit dehydrogenase